MSRKKLVKNFDIYDFDDAENAIDVELAAGFMSGVLEATNNQTKRCVASSRDTFCPSMAKTDSLEV